MSEPIVTPLHGLTTPVRTTLINGHRGQSSTAPENTLPAFLDAAALGADGIELDVHLTADGHVVAHHDQTFRRTTDVDKVFPTRVGHPVSSFTAAEIARLDAGAWKGALWAGTPLPFVADVLKAFRDKPQRITIELKTTPADPVVFAMALRAAVGTRTELTFISFRRPLLEAIRRTIPGARIGLVSVRRPRTVDLESFDEFHLDADFLTQRVVNHIHDRGKTVTAWTVDSPAQATRLAAMGVDAITTNRVEVVRRALT